MYAELVLGWCIGVAIAVVVVFAWYRFKDRRNARATLARFDREMERQKRMYPLPWERED